MAEQVKELQRVNSAEHASNAARLERMEGSLRKALDGKADVEWVREHEGRMRAVEGQVSEGRGVLRGASIAKGAFVVITPFAVVVLTKVLG